jgi:hypothetical protein
LITSNINKKFYLITNKYSNQFKISYFDFYQHILKKNKSTEITLRFFFKNLFLIILSLYSILKIFLFNKSIKANYFIVKKNENNYIDFRSQYYIKEKNLKFKLNFTRSVNFKESLIVFFLYPNIVFINSFKYFTNYFIRINNKDNFYKKKNKQNYFFYLILRKIFVILNIKEISLIDDYRISSFFINVADELKIPSIGYMHGRISRYNVVHKYFAFSKIYVWSNYFRDKLVGINNQYSKDKKIIIKKSIKISSKLINTFKKQKKNYTQINLLYVLDEVTNADLIINNFKNIIKYNKINFFVKFRPNENVNKNLINFCLKNNIIFFYRENIYEIFLRHRINFLISYYSTLLIEASLLGIYPLMIVNNKKDYLSNELIADKAVIPLYSLNNFYKKITSLSNNEKIIKNIKKIIWQ